MKFEGVDRRRPNEVCVATACKKIVIFLPPSEIEKRNPLGSQGLSSMLRAAFDLFLSGDLVS